MEVAPPSITSSPPVINEDSSEAKKITPDTISAIVPSLSSGTRLSLLARIYNQPWLDEQFLCLLDPEKWRYCVFYPSRVELQ